MGKTKVCSIVSGVIGLILIIVSMAGFAFFPKIIEGEINKNLDVTDPESEGYKNFVSRLQISKGFFCNICIDLLFVSYILSFHSG